VVEDKLFPREWKTWHCGSSDHHVTVSGKTDYFDDPVALW